MHFIGICFFAATACCQLESRPNNLGSVYKGKMDLHRMLPLAPSPG